MSDRGEPTVACPTCRGPLSAEAEDWACEVGHRFTFPGLEEGQAEAVVRTLWYAMRAGEDRATANTYMATRRERDGLDVEAERMWAQRETDLSVMDQLHELLLGLKVLDRSGEP